MNPAVFANMGGTRPQQPVNQQVGGMQRNGGSSSDIQPNILHAVQSQPIPLGWQQTISPKQRAAKIHQMVTQLLIVKPDMTQHYAISIATSFEMQQFTKALDQESYNRAWHQKLSEIHATRQNQANMNQARFQNQQNQQNQQMAQMGLTPQQVQAQGMMNGQNQLQPGFGVPHSMQPGQAQMVPMQQQLSQNQRPLQNGNPTEMQQPVQNGHHMQNMPRAGPTNRGQPPFTTEENQQIYSRTRQLLDRMTDQDRVGLHNRLSTTLPATQQQAIQAQGMDLVTAYMRNQAAQTVASEKQKKLLANGQGHRPSANGAMAPQGHPVSQISMRNQQPSHAPPTTQPSEPSLGMGKLHQFVGQQQEGLRHQAAGQDVVPASNGQTVPPQMRGAPHQPTQGQFAINRSMQTPNFAPQTQTPWNSAQNQQPNVQQAAQMPIKPPTTNFNMSAQTPQHQALHGQVGGLGNNRGQRTSQQNPNMPTLNQPMDPPNQTKNDLNQRPSQPTPKQGQRNGLNAPPASTSNPQPGVPQHSQAWQKIPPMLQQQLQRLPEEARKQFILSLQKKQHQQKVSVAAEAQNNGNIQNTPRPGPQGPATAANVGQANNAQQANNVQAPPTANPAGQQFGGTPFDRVHMMKQQGSQQGLSDPGRSAPPRLVPVQMTESQINVMDNYPFPSVIINKNSLGQLPESVKTWRQLKEHVQSSGQNLSPESMRIVLGLQSIHMQQMVALNRQKMEKHPAMAQGNAQPGQPGPAPQAPPMVPAQINQPPGRGNAPAGQFPMPHIPQPTMQEIHAARATLPESQRGLPDKHIGTLIMQHKQQQFLKANHQRLNPQQVVQRHNLEQLQRMSAQAGQPQVGQNQQEQMKQSLQGQGQQPQPAQQHTQALQPPKQPVAAHGRQTQSNRQSHVPPPGQKGPKRPSNDDVVEVPDPKTQQQPRPPVSRPGQPSQAVGAQQKTQEAMVRLSNEKDAQKQGRTQEAQNNRRTQMEATNQNSSVQTFAASANPTAGQNVRRDPAFEALMAEVAQSTPQRPIVPMSPSTRHQMVEKLKDKTAGTVQRTEQTLPVFLQRSKNKDQVKELLRMREHLIRQVKDSGFTEPVESFTITIQELDEYKSKLNSYLAFIFATFRPQPATQPPNQPQQLNAVNLQQHQAMVNATRVSSAQKNQVNNSGRAPAAPTATHPPFSFGSQSPQGVPQFYAGKNELTQEQLKLPVPKKRKPNQVGSTASTPVQAISTPVAKSSPAAKVEPPELQRAPGPPAMFKCQVADCETRDTGFAAKEDLEKHRVEVHEPSEPAIKDPLDAAAYAIESLRIALNLDEYGKSKPMSLSNEDRGSLSGEKGGLQAPAMRTSASSHSQAVKQEAATPMSRNPTQTGPSPSNLLRTPQTMTAIKTPGSDAKSAGKGTGTRAPTAKSLDAGTPDPWANSNVKPGWFKEVFSDVANLNRTVPDDFISGWLERNPFTPLTSPSSGDLDKESPHKSDISTNDNLNINVVASEEDWMLSEWFDEGLRGEMEDLDVGDLMDMNWDTSYGRAEEGGGEETLAKGKRRRDPMEPSDEWLKAWAPKKYEEKMKRDGQKKR